MERFQTVVVVAGLIFFAFSVAAMGVGAISAVGLEKATIQEHARDVIPEFKNMAASYPKEFKAAFGSDQADSTTFADALNHGRNVYIREACWHCHSQFIRPVGNEQLRFGPRALQAEGHTDLQMPVLYGTRRVGPDLSRKGGTRPNDWQFAHFWEPMEVVPTSVMPSFKWFFDKSGRWEVKNGRNETVSVFATRDEANKNAVNKNAEKKDGMDAGLFPYTVREEWVPNRDGLAIVAYIQWLGQWDPATHPKLRELTLQERSVLNPEKP